jgi:hypothetical protein
MTIESLILFLVIGLVAGWLAGRIMKGGGFGLVGDLIVGVIGAFPPPSWEVGYSACSPSHSAAF